MSLSHRPGLLVIGLVLSWAAGLARADVVAVVSAKSPLTALNKTQVANIFLGKATRSPTGLRVVPIDQAYDSAARDTFYVKIAGKSAAQLKAYWSRIIFTGRGQPPLAVSSAAEMKRRLAEDPTAISYIDESLLDDSLKVVLQ